MKNSLIAVAAIASTVLFSSSAFANYYSYERCLNNGGNWFTCLGELFDVTIKGPELDKRFGFVKDFGKERVVKSVRSLSEKCDTQKGEELMICYQKGLKADLKK